MKQLRLADHIKLLNDYYGLYGAKPLFFQWADGTSLQASIYTICETDNGLELSDDCYEEYYSCVIRIEAIMVLPNILKGSILWPQKADIRPGVLIELTPYNVPQQICDSDGVTLWCVHDVSSKS